MSRLLRKLPLAEPSSGDAGENPTRRSAIVTLAPSNASDRVPQEADQLAALIAGLQAEQERLRQEVAALRTRLQAAERDLVRRGLRDDRVDEQYANDGASRADLERVEPSAGLKADPSGQQWRNAIADRSSAPAAPVDRLAEPATRSTAEPHSTATMPDRGGVERKRQDDAVRDAVGRSASRLSAPRLARWTSRLVIATTALICLAALALTVGPRLLPYQTYIVLSGSMEPTIHVGSVVVLEPVAAKDLKVGDVITFQRPDRPDTLVTHRIVALEEGPTNRLFVTKGDANSTPDGWRVPATGNGWRYRFGIPFVGYVLRAFQAPEGRLAFVVLPAIGLGVVTLIELWRPRRPVRQDP